VTLIIKYVKHQETNDDNQSDSSVTGQQEQLGLPGHSSIPPSTQHTTVHKQEYST